MFEGFVRKCSRVPFAGFVRKCARVPFEGFVRKCSRVPFEGFVRFEGFLKMAFSTSGLVKVFFIFQAFPRPLVKFEEFGTYVRAFVGQGSQKGSRVKRPL